MCPAVDENKRPSVISVSIKDKQALYMAYMPYIEGGAIFIQSKKEYAMGEEVFLLLKIMDSDQMPVAGKVVWITPDNAQDSRTKGVGIQFTDEDATTVVSKIEQNLGESLMSKRRTHTM